MQQGCPFFPSGITCTFDAKTPYTLDGKPPFPMVPRRVSRVAFFQGRKVDTLWKHCAESLWLTDLVDAVPLEEPMVCIYVRIYMYIYMCGVKVSQ